MLNKIKIKLKYVWLLNIYNFIKKLIQKNYYYIYL